MGEGDQGGEGNTGAASTIIEVMRTVEIHTEYITLGQLLKLTDTIASGALAKQYLAEFTPTVNDEPDNRRGRKIRPGDEVQFPDGLRVKIAAKEV
jgi:ribosome-associated protein